MRNGWMKFMWPTWPTVGFSAASPVSTRLPPCRPPCQCRPRRSALSSKSRCDADLPHRGFGARAAGVSDGRVAPSVASNSALQSATRRSAVAPAELLAERASRRTSARARTGAAGAARSPARARAARRPATPACRPARRTAIGCFRRTNAPRASFRPLMRPCGIAMPWPRPVEPELLARGEAVDDRRRRRGRRSRANSAPTASNRRAFGRDVDVERDVGERAGVRRSGSSGRRVWFGGPRK